MQCIIHMTSSLLRTCCSCWWRLIAVAWLVSSRSPEVEMKIISSLHQRFASFPRTNTASCMLLMIPHLFSSALSLWSPLLTIFLLALNTIHLCPLTLAFIISRLHSLLLHPGSGSKDRLCLACWSCLSSSPLPTVLKEHTRRWLNTLNIV